MPPPPPPRKKGIQECLYINHYGISWLPSPTPLTSSATQTSDWQSPGPSASLVETRETENKEKNPDDPNQQQKETSKWNTFLIDCATQIQKQYLLELTTV